MIKNNTTPFNLFQLSETYILDGKCIRNVGAENEISNKQISEKIERFENIVIQSGRKIDIYCDVVFIKSFTNMITMLANEKIYNDTLKSYSSGLIKLHVKDNNLGGIK